MFRFI